MISYLRGTLAAFEEDKVVIDVGGVGYGVYMSGQAMSRLPGVGNEVKIHTYLNVKEDAMQLYGFLSRDDLTVFKLLIGVNGIGPKGGLAVLSVMSADSLRFAIMSGDAVSIAKAPGIGKKTAERIILDLKDKVSLEDTFVHREMQAAVQPAGIQMLHAQNEAVEALVALGYSGADALHAVKGVLATEDMDVETILKLALKNMF